MVADTSMDESSFNALEAQRVIDDMHTTPVSARDIRVTDSRNSFALGYIGELRGGGRC